jgi:hypothetical protein
MGARLGVLLHGLVRHRWVRPADLPLVCLFLLSSLARLPFRLMEAAIASNLPDAEPVFIIGHWRSGTTHLHNLLSRSPAFGRIVPVACGLPDELLTLGTWLEPLLEKALPRDRHVDRVAVDPDSPQEDEIPLANQQPVSIFHALYFPRAFLRLAERGIFLDGCGQAEIVRWERAARQFAAKIAKHQGTGRLLIKNPVYTARMVRVLKLWPTARFIYIQRNPYEIYPSTVHYFREMLSQLALQDYAHVDVEAFVLETFVRLTGQYEKDKGAVPPGRRTEVRYESLVQDPLGELERIHREVDLPLWDDARARINEYLEGIRDYRRNAYQHAADDVERVGRAWGAIIERWGYEAPSFPCRLEDGVPPRPDAPCR